MKCLNLLFFGFLILSTNFGFSQFDYYGPEPFADILNQGFTTTWTPNALSSIENRKFVILLDESTQSNVLTINASTIEQIELTPITDITGSSATYGSMLRCIFQIVDENTHYENDAGAGSGTYTPLSGYYKINPFLHSYYNLNSTSTFDANSTDGGTYYISDATNTGYLLIEFVGTPASTTIKAISQWEYNSLTDSIEEVTSWTDRYLKINGTNLTWTTVSADASSFFMADANDLIDLEVAAGSDFNPVSISYQPNATAAIPSTIVGMEDSHLIVNLPNDIDPALTDQLGNSASATTAASAMLDEIETTLINNGDSLRYPKEFYLAVRENMLSQTIGCTDIYNAILGERNIEHIYFTNAFDDLGEPHPFMVIAAHVASTRPNLLVNVNRPPGGSGGPGYAESQVTRHGKLGDFLIKIPLKDYGLISSLLDNDLSEYNDLASDFDAVNGTTTTKDVYNYTSVASIGIAVDGVSIYPGENNNLRFAVEDAEVTSSGIHVGGGLELHYHADGHAFNGNGINLYNLSDYNGTNHPPVIGMSYDGIALFGRYESTHSSMEGYNIPLDEYGGHDHGDGFGYHYHAHTETHTSSTTPFPTFDEHFLLVGAWKGDINNIPGFLEVKDNQLMDAEIGRFAGASYDLSVSMETKFDESISIYPNPAFQYVNIITKVPCEISILNVNGKLIQKVNLNSGSSKISLTDYTAGMYLLKISTPKDHFTRKLIVN